MNTLDKALDAYMQLDFAGKEMLLEILQKRQIEARRQEIAKNAEKSLKEYSSGKSEPLTVNEAIEFLNRKD